MVIFNINGSKIANAEVASSPLSIEAESAILIDATSGQVLFEKNADAAREPASMTKMMTEYLVLDAIKEGKLTWDELVNTSKYASSVLGSGQMIAENEKLPVKDMFALMSIYSGNDGSVALAERIAGGSEDNFVKMMNDKAKAIGMSDKTSFNNVTGLNREDLKEYASKTYTGENLMTARDVGILAQNLLKDHPELLNYTKITSQKLRPADKSPMTNWNWMLEGYKDSTYRKGYAYQGLDGLKTGHTDEAGWCFTGTAERNGLRLITVVMGAKTEAKRFDETRKLMDYGFNNFEKKQLVNEKTALDEAKVASVTKGVELEVPLVTKNGLSYIVQKGEAATEFKVETTLVEEGKRIAPIKKGDVLGTAKITYKNHTQTVDLIADADVEKASWWRLMFRAIGNFFSNLFSDIKSLF
ncbi:D-alanyl-D-alanine carboxypeptidase [Paenibacillus sp. N1-5-1-14]|uniref:D-alanyl-D-alanine carboxypeptidase family protein n=1 Tax=Paenibacillus radicibacter TaxID=2972488 RepID=UPI00215961DF|nr:D-alanyl-D-alanine carboxypeptidase family protein [Paenibacillus radicibacter]MCR8645152.1 D-alanyl-D-alanine carboxypeptidase [Paenibacillus radicibacter]